MREIKFRAWYHRNMHYLGVLEMATLTQGGDDLILISHNEHHVDGSEPLKNAELMQYTGLKDKHCVEIFEGDILEDIWGNRQEAISFVDKHHALIGFMFRPILKNDGLAAPHHVTDMSWLSIATIVGNIYEHPELLEAMKP